jgi:hypothetical protein
VIAFLESCKFDEWDRKELLKALHLTTSRAPDTTKKKQLAAEREKVKEAK